jgi:hypothetical protein
MTNPQTMPLSTPTSARTTPVPTITPTDPKKCPISPLILWSRQPLALHPPYGPPWLLHAPSPPPPPNIWWSSIRTTQPLSSTLPRASLPLIRFWPHFLFLRWLIRWLIVYPNCSWLTVHSLTPMTSCLTMTELYLGDRARTLYHY